MENITLNSQAFYDNNKLKCSKQVAYCYYCKPRATARIACLFSG